VASRVAIYSKLAGSRIRSQTQYRLSFALQLVGLFFFTFLDFVTVLVIFQHLPVLGGWTLPEIAFLYGSSYVAFRAADLLMTNFDKLPLLIRLGTFDQLLTRPLGTLGQVVTTDIAIRQAGGIAQGAAVFVYALVRLNIDWTVDRAILLPVMIVSAFFIFCSIYVATNAVAFWTTDAREVANSFTYGGQYVTQFPMNIFGTWFRRIFGFVIPLAFVNYFPSLHLLGKADPLNAPVMFRFASPFVAALTVVVAAVVWRVSVRHYRSTGS
jgi:ABC-2 type transport system permease protein